MGLCTQLKAGQPVILLPFRDDEVASILGCENKIHLDLLAGAYIILHAHKYSYFERGH